jgi:hypothetical protein
MYHHGLVFETLARGSSVSARNVPFVQFRIISGSSGVSSDMLLSLGPIRGGNEATRGQRISDEGRESL